MKCSTAAQHLSGSLKRWMMLCRCAEGVVMSMRSTAPGPSTGPKCSSSMSSICDIVSSCQDYSGKQEEK